MRCDRSGGRGDKNWSSPFSVSCFISLGQRLDFSGPQCLPLYGKGVELLNLTEKKDKFLGPRPCLLDLTSQTVDPIS